MNYGDFTIGFEQGKEREKHKILEKIECIKTEITELQTYYKLFEDTEKLVALDEVLQIIDKHIGSYTDEN